MDKERKFVFEVQWKCRNCENQFVQQYMRGEEVRVDPDFDTADLLSPDKARAGAIKCPNCDSGSVIKMKARPTI